MRYSIAYDGHILIEFKNVWLFAVLHQLMEGVRNRVCEVDVNIFDGGTAFVDVLLKQ